MRKTVEILSVSQSVASLPIMLQGNGPTFSMRKASFLAKTWGMENWLSFSPPTHKLKVGHERIDADRPSPANIRCCSEKIHSYNPLHGDPHYQRWLGAGYARALSLLRVWSPFAHFSTAARTLAAVSMMIVSPSI